MQTDLGVGENIMQIALQEQVALVTGAAHRVGKAIALELARHGVHLLVHYHSASEETVKETLRDIKSFGVDAFAVQADISQPQAIDHIFAELRNRFSRLNILVNSAANFQKRTLMEVTLEEWEETLRINLTAPMLCTQAAVRMMRENTPPGGCIVNICDKGAIQPWPAYAHHGISKAALHMLSKVSAASFGPENIRVNAIIPGKVLKPPTYSDDAWEKGAEDVPLRRTGTAEDVARAVAYLCTEDWLSGVTIRVDGGEYLT
ncbi:MAG: SDR family oxidoreductase [Anaerolineae bacterium]|nr:SDR family oxidoreductase [Anaerolineae bacterium]